MGRKVEESKENELNDFPKSVSGFFKNGFNFKILGQIIQKDEYRKTFTMYKTGLCFSDLEVKNPTELDINVKNLQVLVMKRVEDLRDKLENES